MPAGKPNKTQSAEESQWPSVNIGNASNPSPNDDDLDPSTGKQLLGDQAEKYLREAANIEDMPDAQDQEEMDETLGKRNNNPSV